MLSLEFIRRDYFHCRYELYSIRNCLAFNGFSMLKSIFNFGMDNEIFGVYSDYQEQYDNIIKVDQGNDDVQFAHVLSLLVPVAVVRAGGGQSEEISLLCLAFT